MDKNLVTNAQFKSFLGRQSQFSSDRFPKEFDNGNYLQHWKTPGSRQRQTRPPVVNVNWYAAFGYCLRPGNASRAKPNGNCAARRRPRHIVFLGATNYPTIARKLQQQRRHDNTGRRLPANPYGLLDMASNVWAIPLRQMGVLFVRPARKGTTRAASKTATTQKWSEIFRDLYPDCFEAPIRGGSFAATR
jgi:formylglycine-generating enzyme required for sulfatase activity